MRREDDTHRKQRRLMKQYCAGLSDCAVDFFGLGGGVMGMG